MSQIVNIYEITATVTPEEGAPFIVTEYIGMPSGVPAGTSMVDVIKKFELYLSELNKKTVFTRINVTSFNLLIKKAYI